MTMPFPTLVRIVQRFHQPPLVDVEGALTADLDRREVLRGLTRQSRIVVAAGSRGIANYPRVLQVLVEQLKSTGASVAILPAMGSHGGGTGPGQVEVLERLGITPESVGAPIVDTMEVDELGTTSGGIDVYADRVLRECDGIVLVNRVKQHTDFHGSIQSGLLKMMAIGLGRARGAAEVHRQAVRRGYEATILEAARFYLERLPILGGVAMIDGPEGGTAHLEVVLPSDMEAAERRLVGLAAAHTLKLPADDVDILIVDRLGKDISGSGMDTKVIGRMANAFEPDPETPRIRRIFVRDLTSATHGNAIGIGLADFTTRRLIDEIDVEATNLNCLTAVTPEKARLPIAFDDDRQALLAAMSTIGDVEADALRLLWIQDTLHLSRLVASPAAIQTMAPEAIDVLGEAFGIGFDDGGDLVPPWEGFPG